MTGLLPIKLETLKKKSVIVTGGASGLGQATATKFAENGAYVTIADIQDEAGQRTANQLCEKGYKVTFVKTDVTDWESSLAAFKHAVHFSPRKTLDIAALFAGLLSAAPNLPRALALADPEPSLDRDPERPEYNILNVNLVGVYRSTQLALHFFRLKPAEESPKVVSGKKSLILMSSLAAYTDYSPTEYGTAKWGVRGLFRSLRNSARDVDSNFRVNLLAPGLVPTSRVRAAPKPPLEEVRTYLAEIGANPKYHVPIQYVVDAASLCATNDEVDGSSFSLWPHGIVDNDETPLQGEGVFRQQMEKSGYWQVSQDFRHSI